MRINILWAASLIITAVAALLFSVSGIFSLTLPEVLVRAASIADLIALTVLMITTAVKLKRKG